MVDFNPIAARNGGYEFVANALDDRARTRAGRQYAAGDVSGATGTLASGGLIGDGMALQRQQAAMAEAERNRVMEDQAEESKWLVQAATGLRSVPYDQRKSVYQAQIRPLLQQNGFDDAELAQVDAADYTDGELDALLGALGGKVTSPYENDRAGPNGSVLRPRADGTYAPVYTPPVDPLDAAYRQAQIDALKASAGQRDAAAARARRPAAGRSGGGSRSSGGGSSRPAAAPARKPWERY
jgi:hypothetical protein